jgi:hypothetical protein
MLMALQEGVSGQKITPDSIGTTLEIPVGNGRLPAVVDGWGNPLTFFRWPTGSLDLNAAPGASTVTDIYGNANYPQPGPSNDPTDPEGKLTSATFLANTTYVTNFQAAVGYTLPARTAAGTAQSYVLRPLVVSSGPDGKLGLDGFAAPDGTSDSFDNLISAAQ